MKRPEETLHRQVAAFLDVVLPSDVVWFHCPNGGGRSKAEAGILKAMGVKAGVPDLYILYRGYSLFIELKPPKRYLTQVQKDMAQRLTQAGATVCTCHSLDEVEGALRALVPDLRGRAA
jgi:hypothetical protein